MRDPLDDSRPITREDPFDTRNWLDTPVAAVATDEALQVRVAAFEVPGEADHIPIVRNFMWPEWILAQATPPELLHRGAGRYAREVDERVHCCWMVVVGAKMTALSPKRRTNSRPMMVLPDPGGATIWCFSAHCPGSTLARIMRWYFRNG